MINEKNINFGEYISYWFYKSPRRVLHSMSYYKFAASLIGPGKKVLDIGCGEGLGTWLLAQSCGYAEGFDLDEKAISKAKENFTDPRINFKYTDFLSVEPGKYDAVVNFDLIEHIRPENAGLFLKKIQDSLKDEGIALIGTPNITSDKYATEVSRAAHINLYSGERLEEKMLEYFNHVFMFGANDEVVHTGFLPMSHYLFALGCRKRS